ncbi:60S acidic ribosomal protein P0 (L10E) isoform 1-like protein [Camelus ferus]|nr:60S acidic ribosomal protein P0 (L10E) isoform 1-like protein [Camelus ferus]
MPREDRATWKSNYFLKVIQLLDDYPKCFLAGADSVGSQQMQQTCLSRCSKAVVLMCTAIRGHLESSPALEKLLPHIWKNMGFVFTKEDLTDIRDVLLASKVPAAARAGAIAPCQVTVPPEHCTYNPEVLDVTEEILRSRFPEGVCCIASVCLQTGYRTVASEAHFSISGYKQVLALSVETDHTFPLTEKVKAFLAFPSALVAAATPVASAASAAAPAKAEAKEESEEWEEERFMKRQHSAQQAAVMGGWLPNVRLAFALCWPGCLLSSSRFHREVPLPSAPSFGCVCLFQLLPNSSIYEDNVPVEEDGQ